MMHGQKNIKLLSCWQHWRYEVKKYKPLLLTTECRKFVYMKVNRINCSFVCNRS